MQRLQLNLWVILCLKWLGDTNAFELNSFRTFPDEEKIHKLQRLLVIVYRIQAHRFQTLNVPANHLNVPQVIIIRKASVHSVAPISISLTSGIALVTAFKINTEQTELMCNYQSQWIDEPKNVWSFAFIPVFLFSFFLLSLFFFFFIQWFFCGEQKIEIYFLLWHCHRIIYCYFCNLLLQCKMGEKVISSNVQWYMIVFKC